MVQLNKAIHTHPKLHRKNSENVVQSFSKNLREGHNCKPRHAHPLKIPVEQGSRESEKEPKVTPEEVQISKAQGLLSDPKNK